MTAPAPRGMTKNEIQEASLAQNEKCRSCRHREVDGHSSRCTSGKTQALPPPPGSRLPGPTTPIYDWNFLLFGGKADDIREFWQPTIAASACVGYQRRALP